MPDKNIYIFSSGELKRKDNTVFFEGEGKRQFIPITSISDIYLLGEVTLNTHALVFLAQNEVLVHYFNYYGYYEGTIYPRQHLASGALILQQAAHYLDEAKRLVLAFKFVESATANMRRVLLYYRNRGKPVDAKIDAIDTLKSSLETSTNIEQLMAIEGNIHEHYYAAFDMILNDKTFRFERRSRRPPHNPMNALISFANSVVYTEVLSEIYRTHLDPRIGFLHTTNFRRFSLQLDIAEIFKPILADRTILSLIGKQELTKHDFDSQMGGMLLTPAGRQKVLQDLDQKLATTIHHRKLQRKVSYRRLIRMECYKLEKHLLGESEYEPFETLW